MTYFILGFVLATAIDIAAFIVLRKRYAKVIEVLNARFG